MQMPIVKFKARGRLCFQFNRVIGGQRIRINKILPKEWTRAQADEYDRIHSAKIIADASGLERGSPLIEDAVHLYLTERGPQLKSHQSVMDDLAICHPYYAGKTFDDLRDISKIYTLDMAGQLANATVVKRLALIRAACRWAWKHHDMGTTEPGARMHLPKVANDRHNYISRRQMIQIARKMAVSTRRVLIIAFYSGMRRGEIFSFALEGNVFKLADSKNSSPRDVPVHRKAAVYARALVNKNTVSMHWASQSFKAAAKSAGMGHLCLHDMRHSSASEMISNGIPLYTVGAILGHQSTRSTQRYAHLTTETLRDAVSKIGQKSSHNQVAKGAQK